MNPDGRIKNEIVFTLSNNENIFTDASIVNRLHTSSDHRLLRATNVKFERRKLTQKTNALNTHTFNFSKVFSAFV